MTRLLTTTAIALTLVTGTAFAQSETNNNSEQVEQNLENAGESMENAGENAAQATENAAEDATQATQNAAGDATQETQDAANGMMENDTNMVRARDILGGTIYSANAEQGVAEFETVTYDSVGDDWDQIGEIEDIVLSSDGKLQGVVAEVGGFLGIGDKHVMVPMDSVKLVPVDDASIALVVGYSKEDLEGLQDVDEAFWE